MERWLKAPFQQLDGTLVQGGRGTPQGSAISPVLANIFLRYSFDRWMDREVPGVPFERFADDGGVHCVSEAQARQGLSAIAQRFAEVGLELHSDKTRIVYCKDDDRLPTRCVGPGGGLAVLLRRHPERVWRLTDNVRQVDPGERAALAGDLGAGKVGDAVAWYLANGRIKLATSREAIMAGMVARWADDIAAGLDSVLIAWRHVSVDELNRQARHAYAALGRLSGRRSKRPAGAATQLEKDGLYTEVFDGGFSLV